MMRLRRPILATLALLFALCSHSQALTLNIRDAANGDPLPHAVVSLPASGPASPLASPAVMAQENRMFKPHLLVIPVGSMVEFPNHDNTQHHVYSFSPAKTFNIELYAKRPEAPVTFDTAGVVELGCNIHDNMQAFIYVTDAGQTVTTGADGVARIEPPTAAPFTIKVWHERLRDNSQPVTLTIPASGEDPRAISLDLTPKKVEADPFADLQRRFDNL